MYASQLFSAGISLGYVSRQLGHAKPTVTADHYAKWVGGDDYIEPQRLEDGEVPADLLARISPEIAHRWLTPDNRSAESEGENARRFGGLAGSGGQTRTADLRLMKPPL